MTGRSQRHKAQIQGVTSAGIVGGEEQSPKSLTAPTVAGTMTQGQTLTGTNGTFSGSPTITRQWTRNKQAIVGATGATYVLAAIDVGTYIQFVNKAVDANGRVTYAYSVPRGPVA